MLQMGTQIKIWSKMAFYINILSLIFSIFKYLIIYNNFN